MLCLEGIVKVEHVWAVQVHHYVALIGNNALFAALEQALFLHQFQCVEFAIRVESCEKHS